LPADFPTSVGRREELVKAKRLLRDTRLITLTGVGGTGKTRLALRVAGDARRPYSGGVRLAGLAPLPDQMPVEYAVAEGLGVQDRSGRPRSEVLINFLRDRELLLVLDNCEHVAGENRIRPRNLSSTLCSWVSPAG
jgi:predicted ATPase